MPSAYVVVNSDIGTESAVLKDIKKIKNVLEVSAVYGAYDVIAKVEADTTEELKEIITSNIRKLKNVRSTLTMIIIQ